MRAIFLISCFLCFSLFVFCQKNTTKYNTNFLNTVSVGFTNIGSYKKDINNIFKHSVIISDSINLGGIFFQKENNETSQLTLTAQQGDTLNSIDISPNGTIGYAVSYNRKTDFVAFRAYYSLFINRLNINLYKNSVETSSYKHSMYENIIQCQILLYPLDIIAPKEQLIRTIDIYLGVGLGINVKKISKTYRALDTHYLIPEFGNSRTFSSGFVSGVFGLEYNIKNYIGLHFEYQLIYLNSSALDNISSLNNDYNFQFGGILFGIHKKF